MDSGEDPQLSRLLREWQAPEAPAGLKPPLVAPRNAWWQFLISGEIRVPVPLGLAVLAALIVLSVIAGRTLAPAPSPAFNLKDFQPVQNMRVRVIRSEDADR